MNSISNLLHRFRLGYGAALALVLAACFLLVSFSIKSYGASYDEPIIYGYAPLDARVYNNLVFDKPYEYMVEVYDLPYYGPAYWLIGEIISSPLRAVFPTLDVFDAWHIVNFATFLLGVWCLFCLSQRFVSQRAALLAALLYLTQPLLWGHGVLNPKDTPFTTFFLASVLVGVRMVEELAKPVAGSGRSLNLLRGRRKYLTGAVLAVSLLSLLDLVFGHFLSRPPLAALIGQAYSGAPGSFLHTLFLRLAANSDVISVTTYINKALQLVNVVEFTFLIIAAGASLVYWFVRTSARNRWILIAGIISGLTLAIRVLGPAALGLVAIYAFSRLKLRALVPLAACVGISLVTTYIFWPYLWSDPLGHLWKSLEVMAQFPWQGQVRFENSDLRPPDLPWYYLPKLMAIQLTLPLLGLAAGGLWFLARSAIRRGLNWGLAAIPALWLLAPVAGVLILHASLYDNFRQFLFIVPPLALLAAIAIEAIVNRLRANLKWQFVFGLAILLPGIAAGAWLHPYEYVYYNALVTWTGGVERQYENDYWFTSICEAARYLDSVAKEGATVATTTDIGKSLFLRCAVKKFDVRVERADVSTIDPDYSVIPTRYDDDMDYFRHMNVIKVVGRGNTIFVVIKQKAAP